ncbi:hypothetical protein [Nocardioides lijunqiniae]|uniref:hypothetical protein n=1 Tax=Nocardioides lijunqiniae TaxID=2760832 RepID=UPI0018787DF8|nr:hypothetical protein [Nocardioides lijunqiniae]
MAQRTATTRNRKGGRPSKGDRHLFQSRVPRDLAETVMDEAERLGLNYSDYIAAVLAAKHNFELPAHYNNTASDNTVQEAFPMQTAS